MPEAEFQVQSSCWYISLLKGTRIDCYLNKNYKIQTNFREIFSIFHKSFLKFYLKAQNRQFDFNFWKSLNKNWNAVICGKKCGKQTCFVFWPYLLELDLVMLVHDSHVWEKRGSEFTDLMTWLNWQVQVTTWLKLLLLLIDSINLYLTVCEFTAASVLLRYSTFQNFNIFCWLHIRAWTAWRYHWSENNTHIHWTLHHTIVPCSTLNTKCDKLFSLQCMNECDVAPTKRIGPTCTIVNAQHSLKSRLCFCFVFQMNYCNLSLVHVHIQIIIQPIQHKL